MNYATEMSSAVIFVDNLRVGGIQRLALDESYVLTDMGIKCTIVTQEDPRQYGSQQKYFTEIERKDIEERNISIQIFNSDRRKFFLDLKSFLNKSPEIELIISHSLRASFSLKLIKFISRRRNLTINTKIHQVPSLVDRGQRFKRLIYAQFTDHLYCFSEAVRSTWYLQFGQAFSKLLIYSKEIKLLRNGVYLPRLPKLSNPSLFNLNHPRLIFLGRLAFWKGLDTLKKIAQEPRLSQFDFLFVIPKYDESDLSDFSLLLGSRMQVVAGKSVGELQIFAGDVHLYPTQYGENSLITESVSLNCLELLGVGIPSLVTAGGQITWGEKDFSQVFFEVDWANMDEVVNQIMLASKFVMDPELHSRLRSIIDVKNEIVLLRV